MQIKDSLQKKHNLKKNWSRQAVLYQIYPRSFKDTNKDGIGDLLGIINKLDYLNDGTKNSLGIEAIWLSPIYQSPQADFGYDISDYRVIDPIFGDLKIFKKLLDEAHSRGIKIIMDFVPNHTSVEHKWFKESRLSKNNPKRDWYIWRDGGKDKPPNNWLSVFGGSAWEFDKTTGQYYMHSFLKQQADLNWRNEKVRTAMLGVLDFWLDFGVDGFRTDAVYHLIKDKDFKDDPKNPNYAPGSDDPYDQFLHVNSQDHEPTLDNIKAFCNLLGAHHNKFLVSEAYLDLPEMQKMYQACENNLHAPFNFNLITTPWMATEYKKFIDEFEKSLSPSQWPNYVMGNHDRPRIAHRLGRQRARIVAMLLMTLRGMPLIYYGDELGMEGIDISMDDCLDPFARNVPGLGLGRDPERSPMQWDDTKNAGFTTGKPWLPVEKEFKKTNVKVESSDKKSLLNLYKTLIHFRKSSPALLAGKYVPLDSGNNQVYVFKRESREEKMLVVLNFSDKLQLVSFKIPIAKFVLNTGLDIKEGTKINLKELTLKPNEGHLFAV
ncbi:MAG: alpha-amylase [Candidatus Doudnabacteria bacterium CG10_big_fil_rev_8_21_14_0_10_41_10]|uniref:Alpha-amylase n=1 Tax=Candidatus Doudnabacteria bacterium CG10_big_fil_rev_8_21_14_0_10_41_10 TaxID=1974551 RepID=A0A2H0VCT9_9BACT|nr:MAG: alpha-amylase [Candidatus Doudnabacteria bacterium CG10_big_fil_rev_8_21_14_0_10_41_10]